MKRKTVDNKRLLRAMEQAGIIRRPDPSKITLPSAREWGGKRGHNNVVAPVGEFTFRDKRYRIANDADKTFVYETNFEIQSRR